MNYAALPPEVNSLRMYTGPGSAPMRAAAAAWSGLAAELHAAVNSYEAVITELTAQAWLGPASLALTQSAARYAAWMAATAAQVDHTAAQANAAAAAYETAFSATVPPTVVAANRAQLMLLVATNVLGTNTAAIAANEAEYGEMWAQDAAAMYAYAASSAAATGLAPFQQPPQTSNPGGPVGQAAAAGAAEATSSSSNVQSLLSQLASGISGTPNNSAVQAGVATVAGSAQGIEDLFTLPSLTDIVGLDAVSAVALALAAGAWSSADASTRMILKEQDHLEKVEYEILNAIDLFSPLTPSRPAVPGAAGLTAAMGDAISAGNLSVPINWAANAPEIRTLSYTTPLAGPGVGGAPAASLAGAGSAFSQMALAGMGGSALAGSVSRGRGGAAAAAAAAKVQMPQRAAGSGADSAAGEADGDGKPGPSMMGIAAEIREFAELRDRGLITNDEYNEQKMRLLGR
ncbi:PPE family protein, SVP subgroup [Mycolicibacter kumamotonensis]|uniref:PPE domain-containing protein n=1 Tax=Mycolicibacter kumamotonensis TaxID=354243 RepID=A0A7K3LFS9_9MYCO|nr:PPE domain-containing protein [Mycolicibacter kumamotonensis]NDJ91225.1 PPE domain-containing protein [Mycolicibacter kumamotonensis]